MKRVNKYLSIFLSTVMIGLSINPVNTHVFAETDEGIPSEIVSVKDNDNTESVKDLKDKNLSADSSEENEAEVPSEEGIEVKPEASEFSTLNLLKDDVSTNVWLETDFTYFEDHHLEENAVCISGLSVLGQEKQKNNHDLVLPDEIAGKKVLAIAKNAFSNRKMDSKTQFISVKLPQYLKVVGDSAFAGNLLTAIEFPDTLMELEVNAFAFNHLKEVLIPESVQAIEIHAFYNNKILQGNAKIDNEKGKVKVGFEAFADNGEDGATEVTPVYLKSEANLNWTAEDFEFYYDPIPGTDEDGTGFPDVNYTVKGFSEKGKEKLKKNKNVVLPSADTKGIVPVWVLEDSFKGEKIESVEIPKNYTHVQFRAFQDCGLKKVVFHDGLLYANDSAFENNELTEVKFPSTFRYPSKAAFKGNQLTEIKLPESCQSIGPESFMNNQLVKVEMGSKVVHIYEKAFANNQLTEVNIPKSLKNQTNGVDGIKKDAFDGNPGKTNPLNPSEKKVLLWTPNKDNPNNLISRGNYVVDPVAENNEYQPSDFTYNKENEVKGFSKKGSKKFNKMKDKPVILPAKTDKGAPVVGIDEAAFADDAVYIKAIVIPEGYMRIGDQAFSWSEIEEIDAPSTLQEIGENSFLQSANVVKIHTTKTVAERIKNTSDYWEIIADKEEPSVPQPSSKWETEDFVFGTFKVIELEDDGSQKEVELNAVSGFSQKGLEKLKTVKDLQLPTVDAKGNKVEAVTKGAFSAKLGDKRLNSLQIPEGYRAIGSMAFAFNGCKGELVLPDSIEFVDMAAFFRNEFTSLTVPAKMTDIPLSMMRGNKLSSVIFKGNVETIGRLAFSENRIEEITVPDSLKSIGEQAFTTNTGSDKYDGKVIIRTVSGTNPNKLQDKENYLVDPKNQGTNPSINYKEWKTDDFRYEGTTVTGFSKQGNLKIKKNKNLVIPDKTPDGKSVTVIGMDAFRNLNQGYDIESVKLPDTIVEIEDYALQFNDIHSITLPRDLKKLGMGVFMMSNVNEVKWNENLEYIDQACFFMCELGKIEVPSSVETIMNAAFRKCSLTEVTFEKDSKLKTIQSLAFADNKLSTIVLPNKLEVIGSQAFGNNKFTELNVPGTLKEIGFQAFVNNPGIKEYDDAVVIHTPGEKNPNALVDDVGKTFIVDPKVKATEADKQELKSAIDKAEEIDSKKLTEEYKKFFEDTLKDAKSAYTDNDASKSKVRSVTKALLWANKRAELNRLMFEKESLDAKSSTFDKEKWKVVEKAYESAKKNLMVINITDTKVEQLIHNLSVALKSLETDPLEGATAYEGEANVPKSHYITPYTIKVKVWVKDGKIVHVRDNGTVCDDPNDEEKPNEGYYNRAVPIMHQYIGKTVEEVMGNSLGKDLGIDVVSKATVSCNVIHQAVQNALSKSSQNPSVIEIKAQLKKYVDSVKPDVLKLAGIATDGNKAAIEKFNAHLERAKALLVKEDSNITKAELEEMQKMPSYKKDGKKIKGSFSKIVKDMRADFKVLGERSKKNKHNGQMYPVLKSGEIKIESKIAGLKKEGDKRLYLNYVTKEEYGKNFDVIGSATPKYDKKTVPAESYTVTEDNGIYTIQLKNVPEDAVIIKPVIKVQLAEMTFVENGDLVYVKEQTSNEGNSSSGKDKKDKKDKKEDNNKKKEQEANRDNLVGSAEEQTKKPVTVVCDLNKDTIITTIDGKKVVKKADVPPYLKDNRLMLSVRFLAEELGYQVKWDNKTKTVTLQDGNTVCTLKVGSNEMIINGEVVHLDTQPEVKKGRVMVPVSSVVKAFRLKQGTSERSIVWDAKEKKITISVMK
ncbi:leucine-rich repeat protein [Filifactor alocis]|uniref:leucine-rich repeat protein n=1 Tax=Filifactor alocis TaxID=143361 RepID=UPI003FA176DC